jgi:hypothetical protein
MPAFLSMVVDRISFDDPATVSCSASKLVAPYNLDHAPPSVAFWIC